MVTRGEHKSNKAGNGNGNGSSTTNKAFALAGTTATP